MVTAVVLLTVVRNKIHIIAEKLADIKDVTEVYSVAGRYDLAVIVITAGLGLHRNEAVKYIEELSSRGRIEAKPHNQQLYYQAVI